MKTSGVIGSAIVLGNFQCLAPSNSENSGQRPTLIAVDSEGLFVIPVI